MQHPLIFQNTSAGIGTLIGCLQRRRTVIGLPRLHRAGPSASLDKSVAIQLWGGSITGGGEFVK